MVERTLGVIEEKGGVEWRLPEDRDGVISYKRLIEEVYSGVGGELEGEDPTLEWVIEGPLITNEHLNMLLEQYCGSLVREPLVTCYVAEGEIEEGSTPRELDSSRVIVVSMNLVNELLKSSLYRVGERVMAIKLEPYNNFRVRSVSIPRSRKYRCKWAARVGREYMLLIRGDKYIEGVGLEVDAAKGVVPQQG